jgi:excisionase family DNA binding protein
VITPPKSFICPKCGQRVQIGTFAGATEIALAERLIDVAVVARRLQVSASAVRNWIIAGKLSAIRTPSGRYRVPLSELARVINTRGSQASQL